VCDASATALDVRGVFTCAHRVASIATTSSISRTLTSHHSRAPAMPEVEHSDDSVSSLVDVDSPHISSVPSDYESQSIKTDTQAEREAKDLKEKAAAKKEQAKDKAEQAKEKMQKNSDNPVVLSNAVGLAVVAGVLGIGAYRKYAHGELTGKLVAAWVGVIGLFGVGDYYVSQ
jgi:F0F1-type ATP synthase assembly protein I